MGKITKGQTKNFIRRSLSEIIRSSPTKNEIKDIWEYFNNCCAYCWKKLSKGEGHVDHLIPFDKCGKNGKYNRVLSCSTCNSKEKLDKDWDTFLKEKCGENEKIYTVRRNQIKNWISNDKEIISKEIIDNFFDISEKICNEYILCFNELNDIMEKKPKKS